MLGAFFSIILVFGFSVFCLVIVLKAVDIWGRLRGGRMRKLYCKNCKAALSLSEHGGPWNEIRRDQFERHHATCEVIETTDEELAKLGIEPWEFT